MSFRSLNRQPLLEMLTEKEIDDIHYASLEILADVGIDVFCDETRALLYDAGAHIRPLAQPRERG